MNRRQFLQRGSRIATTLVTAPHILPRNVSGAEAPSKKISVGIIDVGRQTQNINIPLFIRVTRHPWFIHLDS